MTIDLTQIGVALISLACALITRYIVPWLKSKTENENGKKDETKARMMQLAIDTAVNAAEQLYHSDEGEKKKSYVLGLLQGQGYTVNSAALDAAVEASVYRLKNEIKGADKQ